MFRGQLRSALRAVRTRRYLLYPTVLLSLGAYAASIVTGVVPIDTVFVPVVLACGSVVGRVSPVDYTRRGWGVIAAIGVGLTLASMHGERSLPSVIAPLALATVAATASVLLVDRPDYRRILPENGHVGERRTVGIRFDVSTPKAGVVEDAVGEGLSSPNNRVEATIDEDPVEYDVVYERRGARTVGPLTLTVRDVLGLASKTFEYPEVGEVVVYPEVQPLAGITRHELTLLAGGSPEREREEFHRLREYVTGDSLRDVHWKTSARQPDDELVVKEFVAEDQFDEVTIVAEAPERDADRLASAVASVAVHMMDRGIEVGVTVADGSVPPSIGPEHRARLLELLGRTDAGEIDGADQMDADIVVETDRRGVLVTAGDYQATFDDLVGSTPPPHSRTGGTEVVA